MLSRQATSNHALAEHPSQYDPSLQARKDME